MDATPWTTPGVRFAATAASSQSSRRSRLGGQPRWCPSAESARRQSPVKKLPHLQDKGQYPALTERQHAVAGHLVVGRADPATAGAAVAVTIAGHAVGRLRRYPPARRRAVLPGDWVTRTVPGADARVGR